MHHTNKHNSGDTYVGSFDDGERRYDLYFKGYGYLDVVDNCIGVVIARYGDKKYDFVSLEDQHVGGVLQQVKKNPATVSHGPALIAGWTQTRDMLRKILSRIAELV